MLVSKSETPETPPKPDTTCRGFANAASMTFGILKAEVRAVDGGWRDARMLDGDFAGWLCPHVHVTIQDAERWQGKASLLADPDSDSEER